MIWGMKIAAFVISAIALLVSLGAAYYTRKQASIMQAQLDFDKAKNDAYSIPWSITWMKGNMWALNNDSNAIEYDVEVELYGNYFPNPLTSNEIHPRAHMTLKYEPLNSSREVIITWSRERGGERLKWVGQMPHKD